MRTIRHICIACALTLILVGIVFAVGLWNLKIRADAAKIEAKARLRHAEAALKDMEPGQAALYLELIQSELRELNDTVDLWRQFVPFLAGTATTLENATGLAGLSIDIARDLDFVKREGAGLVLGGKGSDFVAALSRLSASISAIAPTAGRGEAYEAIAMLDASIAWLTGDTPQHILIMFQNPSEIRPGGGFLGSFAHLTLHKGSITALEVQDIYDLDGQMVKKVIPPVALQRLTPNWGARDANWFADFPRSARKVSQFLEDSRIFRDRGIRFSAVIAINVNLIRDILDIVGPLTIPQDHGAAMTVTADTFLADIQKEVETAQNKGIVKQATPALFEKIGTIDSAGKKRLALAVGARFARKDIMAYFVNPIMESFVTGLNAAGDLYPAPEAFAGSYLSVSVANIAGGKTDLNIIQSIDLTETVNRDGSVISELSVTRAHATTDRPESWYRATNKAFIRIFTAPGTEELSLSGGYARDIKPIIDYAALKYVRDPDLAAEEARPTISTWLDVPMGETKTISASYHRQSPLSFNTPETPYTFAFDRQSGVEGPLSVTLYAPAGMIWKESGTAIFSYRADDPPARVTIPLTIIRP